MNHVYTQQVYSIEYNPTIMVLPSELCETVKCDLLWIIFFRLNLVRAVYTSTQWAHQIWFESGENIKSFPCKTFS